MSVLRRRRVLALLGSGGLTHRVAGGGSAWRLRALVADEPLRRIRAGGPSAWLGLGISGALWALSAAGASPRQLVRGLHAESALATGHDRIAARTAQGELWVWEDGRATTSRRAGLAVHAGLLILPLAVIAVVADGSSHRVVRFEPDAANAWREVARSTESVLADARPLLADLDGRGDGGHIVVFAGADSSRYDHGVLGDAVEATRLVWLERHRLDVLSELTLPAPFVFEDIAPRPVAWARGAGLLTMRSGRSGTQLVLLAADPARADRLRVAALGDSVGGRHRWLAPTTDGRRILAVHTPHIGGVLHEYRHDGERLTSRRLSGDVSTHRIGSRETDLAVWRGSLLVVPSQDGRRLRVLDAAVNWLEQVSIDLPARVVMTSAAPAERAFAVLLEDGQMFVVEKKTA